MGVTVYLNCSSSTGFDPNAMTMTKLSASFPATLCRTSSILFRANHVVEFFDSFELLLFSLSYLLIARSGSAVLLGPCQVLVVQSFAFSFRLSKVRSLIEWLLRSFCIQRENPMRRILNSCSFCDDVEVLLQGDSVVHVFFSPPDVIQ